MNFIVRRLDPLDLRGIAEDAAEEHARPYLAGVDFAQLAGGFAGFLDDEIVGCAGLTPIYGPGSIRAVAWALLFPVAKEVFLPIHKAVKQYLDEAPYRRIEAHTDAAFSSANRWAELLGFILEAEGMRNWFPNCSAANQWVKLK